MTTRRAFISGLIAAPLVVRTPGLLMPVRPVVWDAVPRHWVMSHFDTQSRTGMFHHRLSVDEPPIPAEAPAGARWRLIEPKGA